LIATFSGSGLPLPTETKAMTNECDYAYVGFCRICGQGRLFVLRDNVTGDLYVMCEDCESEWLSPSEALNLGSSLKDTHGASTNINVQELEDHEWLEYVTNK
jgi:hypothetical protein